MATGGTVVVLVSRSSEEPRPSSPERALVLSIQEAQVSLDAHSRAEAQRPRSVVACVSIATSRGSGSREMWNSLAKRLAGFVRQDDRICLIGSGRLIVMFKSVDPGLHAQVLGARLAGSAAQTMSDLDIAGQSIRVGVADGDPETDPLRLSLAAIGAAKQSNKQAADDAGTPTTPFLVVHTSIPEANGSLPKLARRVVKPVDHFVDQSSRSGRHRSFLAKPAEATILIVDSAPSASTTTSPATAAVRSLVSDAGLGVAGTISASSSLETDVLSLADTISADSIALVVVHPSYQADGADEPTGSLERPAGVTLALRQLGMRVLAVSVGANEIALAECLLQGAESAFSLADLPDELTHALTYPNGDRSHPEQVPSTEHSSGRSEGLQKLLLLTRSERRVLYHLTTGATAIEIAEKLVLSLATVRSHIRSILRKLEVSSQLAAVAIAQGHPVRPAEGEHERI